MLKFYYILIFYLNLIFINYKLFDGVYQNIVGDEFDNFHMKN